MNDGIFPGSFPCFDAGHNLMAKAMTLPNDGCNFRPQSNSAFMLLRLGLVFVIASTALPASSASPVADSLTFYYAMRDTDAIERLYRQARTTEERLLCSYRLFPLTQDEKWLDDLPEESELRTARGLALLAAHWGFRATSAPAWRLPTYGRRSEGILRRAQQINFDEPYVLLVDGQSLYYKPAIFGGDVEEAKARFERLRVVLHGRTVPGIHSFEPEVWIWVCLRKMGNSIAPQLREQLLGRQPPPLFRQFLNDPP